MLTRMKKAAFTLIELLVVVAIIVILIAILVPALNKALYLAALAECAGNMDGTGTAVITYAHANKESYPYRPSQYSKTDVADVAVTLDWFVTANTILFSSDTQEVWDDRPIMEDIFDYNKSLQCPLSPEVPLNHPDTQPVRDANGDPAPNNAGHQGTDDRVYSSYDIYWGFAYNGEGRMQKLGSRMTWTDRSGNLNKWNLLMADLEYVTDDYEYADALSNDADVRINIASHPDSDGSMGEVIWDPNLDTKSGKNIWWGFYYVSGGAVNDTTQAALRTGLMDRNFLSSDGSVHQIKDIKIRMTGTNSMLPGAAPATQPPAPDDRFMVVPYMDSGTLDYFRTMLPNGTR